MTRADLQTLGATGSGRFDVSFEWTPQRWIWVALGVSAATIALCLALALVPRRLLARRTRRRREDRAPEVSADHGLAAREVADDPPDAPQGPVLSSPLRAPGDRPAPWVVAVVSVVTGLVAGAITSPPVGAVAAVLTGAALLVRRLRTPLTVAAVGFVIAAGASVIAGQAMHAVPESSNWPLAYDTAGLLAWFGVVALGVDAVVTSARTRRRKP